METVDAMEDANVQTDNGNEATLRDTSLIATLEYWKKNMHYIKDTLGVVSDIETTPFIMECQENVYTTICEIFLRIAETISAVSGKINDFIDNVQSQPEVVKNSSEASNDREIEQPVPAAAAAAAPSPVPPEMLSKATMTTETTMPAAAPSPVPPEMLSKATMTTDGATTATASDALSVRIIKKAYTDLLKAKIEFDSCFIDFNATLNQSASSADFRSFRDFSADPGLLLGQTSAAASAAAAAATSRAPSSSKRKLSISKLDDDESPGKRPRRSLRLRDKSSSSAGDCSDAAGQAVG